jgi:hypothetical protein
MAQGYEAWRVEALVEGSDGSDKEVNNNQIVEDGTCRELRMQRELQVGRTLERQGFGFRLRRR